VEEAQETEATAKVVTALAMAAVVGPEARGTEALEAVAAAVVAVVMVARKEMVEAQMAATRSMRSTAAGLRYCPCPRWCASSIRPLAATTQDESTGEGSRRRLLHLGTSGTPRPASWPTPCTQHAWG